MVTITAAGACSCCLTGALLHPGIQGKSPGPPFMSPLLLLQLSPESKAIISNYLCGLTSAQNVLFPCRNKWWPLQPPVLMLWCQTAACPLQWQGFISIYYCKHRTCPTGCGHSCLKHPLRPASPPDCHLWGPHPLSWALSLICSHVPAFRSAPAGCGAADPGMPAWLGAGLWGQCRGEAQQRLWGVKKTMWWEISAGQRGTGLSQSLNKSPFRAF